MFGSEGGEVDLGAPRRSLVVGDLRQLPARSDQAFGESCLVENPQRARMDCQGVAVLGRPLVLVDDLHADPVLLQEQGRDETDRTGADDENLRIRVTKHQACSPRALRAVLSNLVFASLANPCSRAARRSRQPAPSRT